MIVLFTDFGIGSPYIGQMQNVLFQHAPGQQIIILFSDAPTFDARSSAYLLPAYIDEFAAETVFLCVVDPGVGSVARKPVMLRIDERWYVGPDNGLFNVVAMRARDKQAIEWWDITWQPDKLSSSFHGRDLFAPVAAMLANGDKPQAERQDAAARIDTRWPEELEEIIYIDHFGNAITGIRADAVTENNGIVTCLQQAHGERLLTLKYARTFSEVPPGQGFWYRNANGLVEIAVNQGSARDHLALTIGSRIRII